MASKQLNRRNFVQALGLGTAHLMLGSQFVSCKNRLLTTDPFQRVSLGNSGIKTSLIGMGTGVHATNRQSFLTRQERQKSIDLIRHAYDTGIRYFDAADTYGTHGLIAEALQTKNRNDYTLTTKIWQRAGGIPEKERFDAHILVDRFRKELNTDYIDLVQLHCMVDEDWTTTMKPQMDALEDLKAKGIIRAHGVSVHSLPAMKAALKSDWVDVVHARINPYGIAMDKPDPQEVVDVIQQLHSAGKGVIGMKLIGNGKLRDHSEKIDNALRFVLGIECVDMIIIGFETKDQINNYRDRVTKALHEI